MTFRGTIFCLSQASHFITDFRGVRCFRMKEYKNLYDFWPLHYSTHCVLSKSILKKVSGVVGYVRKLGGWVEGVGV